MSNIIAFPKCRSHVRPDNAHARIGENSSSLYRINKEIHSGIAHPDRVEPIWKFSQNGILISVVIPTCNRPSLLNRCLASLARQTLDHTRFEIIVADDQPSKVTREIVEKWSSRTAVSGPKIYYLPSDGSHGAAAARNRGWLAARGTLIAFTDDDTIPYGDWLTKGLRAFDGVVQAVWGRIAMPVASLPADIERKSQGLDHPEFVTANCFCLKHILEKTAGFDERFRVAGREDADFYCRLLKENIPIGHAPDSIVERQIRSTTWSTSLLQQKKIQFDALLYKKHPLFYRQKIQPSARWDYYAIVASLLLVVSSLLMQRLSIASVAAACWILLTARYCMQRLQYLQRKGKTRSHVAEILLTSAMIPPLAVFWRLVGIIRFRVVFL